MGSSLIQAKRQTGQGFSVAQRDGRQATSVDFHSVLVAVDIAVFEGKPFVVKRGQTHQAEGIVERFVETSFAKLPSKGGDRVGEAFGGFVARPAGGEAGNGAGLQQVEATAGKCPFGVLRKAEISFGAACKFGDLCGLHGGEGGLGLAVFRQPKNFAAAVCAAYQGGGFGSDVAFYGFSRTVHAIFVYGFAAGHHSFA